MPRFVLCIGTQLGGVWSLLKQQQSYSVGDSCHDKNHTYDRCHSLALVVQVRLSIATAESLAIMQSGVQGQHNPDHFCGLIAGLNMKTCGSSSRMKGCSALAFIYPCTAGILTVHTHASVPATPKPLSLHLEQHGRADRKRGV